MPSANFTRYAKSSARVVITTGIQNSTRKLTEFGRKYIKTSLKASISNLENIEYRN